VRIRAGDVTNKIERLKDCEVIRLRGKLLPLVRLTDALGMQATFTHPEVRQRETDRRQRWSDRRNVPLPEKQADEAEIAGEALPDADRRAVRRERRTNLANAVKIIVCKFGERHFGLVVEEVYDNEEIVVKPLSGYLKSCQCYAGSTIMGDGSVAMILDTNGIAVSTGLKFGELEKDFDMEKDRFLKEGVKKQHEMLLFTTGENSSFGVDLSMVARVEKIERSRIESVGGKEFLKYDDRSMRVIRLQDYLPVNPGKIGGSHTYVIVPKDVKYVMGIVADSMKDVIKTDATLDVTNIRGPGILGSAIINSALTILIDVPAIFKLAEPELCA
jgi:two-component system, chemotaxis family, sensor kinase CheA